MEEKKENERTRKKAKTKEERINLHTFSNSGFDYLLCLEAIHRLHGNLSSTDFFYCF